MSTIASVLIGLAVGVAVGALFFAGLWQTVRRLPDARRPALFAMGSLLFRVALAAAGFILIARAGWLALLAALLAFLAVRRAAIARWGPGRRGTHAADA